MASDIDHILSPERLTTFQYQSPVTCIVWRGQNNYERIQLDTVYPFDTVDMLKRLVFHHYNKDPSFLPRFLFMGISMDETNLQRVAVISNKEQTPTENTQYLPVDFLWYPIGNNKPESTFHLADPTLGVTDTRFFAQGIFTNPNYEERGRSTIEDILIKPYGTIPVLHVFRLQDILRSRVIQQKITSEEWYGKYTRYFPNVSFNSTYEADADDMRFGRTIDSYIDKRKTTIHLVERLLTQRTAELRYGSLTAIQYVRLLWQHRVRDFDGCAGMFYNINATETRPYIRLLPSEGIPITKIHVQGALPIPTLDDPRLLSVWTKETSATPGSDMCIIKYVHRPIIGTTQSVYGTIHVLNDGTMTLLLQPPKEMRTLDPVIDFKHFTQRIVSVFDGLPQQPTVYSIKDISLKLMFDTVPGSKLFTYKRLKARLPYFSYFFREIKKLPDDDAMMVLRYKAISQYTSEDEYFTFITQVATELKLQGDDAARVIIPRIESEFQITETEARSLFTKWIQQKEQLMVQVPKDGEFTENNNPGIDIKIYSQHSTYYFQINRINSVETYKRIYTLLSILFIDKDEYFKENPDVMQLEKVEDTMLTQSKMIEATVEAAKPVKKVNPLLQKMTIGKKVPLAAVAAASDMDAAPVSALPGVKAVTAAPIVAAAAAASVKEEVSELEHAEQKLVNPTSWFINKLEMIDKKLFGFTPTSGTKGYTSQCQANAGRQPVILTKYLYDRMRKEYTDPDLFWIIYPLTKVEKDPEPRDKDEVITIMRYGSSVDNVNYIFCPEYYCLSCEIMVRKKDFESPNGRKHPSDPPEKNPGRKPVNTCPFCKGTVITQTKGAVPGATVVRRIKTPSQKSQTSINFFKNTNHPSGLSLPCCFSESKKIKDMRHIRLEDKTYDNPATLREYLQQDSLSAILGNNEENEDEAVEERYDYSGLAMRLSEINYKLRFKRIHIDPIIESNKNPHPGSAAAVSALFDVFFAQDTYKTIVSRAHINLKLQPKAQGFLRMGTEHSPYESLLGVIAPIIDVSSIQDVKDKLYQLIELSPRLFMMSHFGNLVLEFYNPADISAMPANRFTLADWAEKNLSIVLDSSNFYELLRIYNSHTRFLEFIKSSSTRKELRHIQPFLAEPGLLYHKREKGVQLIIMEIVNDAITIKCPVFGVSRRHYKNDYVFISKTMRKIAETQEVYPHYELYLYTHNRPAKGKEIERHDITLQWDVALRAKWPRIVTDRVNEYKTLCTSRYRTIYTSSPTTHPDTIIPLSRVLAEMPGKIIGMIKDSYNHIIAVVLRKSSVSEVQYALPVIDDGIITNNLAMKTLYLHWNHFMLSAHVASVESVINYYTDFILKTFKLFPGYQVKHVVKTTAGKIIAIQLQNNIYVPVNDVKKPDSLREIMEKFRIDFVISNEADFQWNIDAQLNGMKEIDIGNWSSALEQVMPEKSCGSPQDIIKQSTYSDFEEQYQQFRYMVANYVTEPQIKQDIEKIILTKHLPYFEKRQRLFIYLGSTMHEWFHEDDVWEGPTTSFLRKDCRVITSAEKCTGSCYWKPSDDEKNDNGEGQCLLHVSRNVSLDGTDARLVSTSNLFIRRMIDELISFPYRRHQLLKKGEISKVAKITKAIRVDDQYIIPESSMTWTDLLRLEWLTKHTEKPLFYEEMSREGTEDKPLGILPLPLQEIFGTDTPLYMHIPDDQDAESPFLSIASILTVPFQELGIDNTAQTLTRENLMAYVTQTHRPIGFIDVDEQKYEFVKEDVNTYLTMLVIVRINKTIGVLIENNMDNFISISLLPHSITDKWIIMRTATVIPSQPPGMVPLLATRAIVPLRRIKAPTAAATAPPVAAPPPTRSIVPISSTKSLVAPKASAAPAVAAPAVTPPTRSIVPISSTKSLVAPKASAAPTSAVAAASLPRSIVPMSGTKSLVAPKASAAAPSAVAAAPSAATAPPVVSPPPTRSIVPISSTKSIQKTIRRNASAASAANAP